MMHEPEMSPAMRQWIDRAAAAVVEHMNGAPLEVIPYNEPRRSPDRRGQPPGRWIDERGRP